MTASIWCKCVRVPRYGLSHLFAQNGILRVNDDPLGVRAFDMKAARSAPPQRYSSQKKWVERSDLQRQTNYHSEKHKNCTSPKGMCFSVAPWYTSSRLATNIHYPDNANWTATLHAPYYDTVYNTKIKIKL